MEEIIDFGSMGEIISQLLSTYIAQPAQDVIGDVLPIALPVMGAIVVIGIGVKVFKRFIK